MRASGRTYGARTFRTHRTEHAYALAYGARARLRARCVLLGRRTRASYAEHAEPAGRARRAYRMSCTSSCNSKGVKNYSQLPHIPYVYVEVTV